MYRYNPFGKDISDLEIDDLAVLKRVSEGWYVEYKRQPVGPSKLAKALSAFANTYGGWLFLGVQEAGKEEPVAGEFLGIPKEDLDGVVQQLRSTAAANIDPTPHFEYKVLRGPSPALNLEPDRAILVVATPSSVNAPHIHKDGRIYRRTADASEPTATTDRHVVDELMRRGREIRRRIREWVVRDPDLSKEEAHTPFVRLLFCVDPWRQRRVEYSLFAEMREILIGGDPSISLDLPFDWVYPTAEGLMARQLKGNDPSRCGLTWRMARDMSSDVLLPLPTHTVDNPEHLVAFLSAYKETSRFVGLLNDQGHDSVRVVDLNFLFYAIVCLKAKYRRLLKAIGAGQVYYYNARLLNCWRTVPFLDVGSAIDIFEKHGVPMIMDDEVTVLGNDGPESFVRSSLELSAERVDDAYAGIGEAAVMFNVIVPAFGVPVPLGQGEDEVIKWYEGIANAGTRAQNIRWTAG